MFNRKVYVPPVTHDMKMTLGSIINNEELGID